MDPEAAPPFESTAPNPHPTPAPPPPPPDSPQSGHYSNQPRNTQNISFVASLTEQAWLENVGDAKGL